MDKFINKLIKFNIKYNLLDGNKISDTYHTFDELYDFRMLYNACLFNEWAKSGEIEVYKSLKHNDGKLCFNGKMFIVIAILPTGQISNHYTIENWDLFQIPEYEKCIHEYDNHTSLDVITRIKNYIMNR